MRYRYKLGKTLDTATNLINDSNFATACGAGNWVCGAGWAPAAGVMIHTWPAADSYFYQEDVFTPGEEYYISVDHSSTNNSIAAVVYVGDYSIDELTGVAVGGLATLEADKVKCISTNTNFSVRSANRTGAGAGNLIIERPEVFQYHWNDPIEIEPGQWDEAFKMLEKSTIIPSLVTSFLGNLVFIKDSYTYLLAQDFGSVVPILIEFWDMNLGSWQRFYEGDINTAEMRPNYKFKKVETEIEQNGFGNYLRTQYSNKVLMSLPKQNYTYYRRLTMPIADVPPFDSVTLHDSAIAPPNDTVITRVLQQLRHLVEVMVQSSQMTIAIESAYLALAPYSDAGDDIWLGNVYGHDVRVGTVFTSWDSTSMEDYVLNYGNVLNLVYRFYIDANNIPTLVVEDFASVVDRVPTIVLDNVDIQETVNAFSTEPKTILTGYTNAMPGHETEEVFQYISFEKGLVDELNVQPTWARSTHIIYDLNPAANSQFDAKKIFIEYYWDGAIWRSRQTLIAGKYWYNQNCLGDVYVNIHTEQKGTAYRGSKSFRDIPDGPLANPLTREFEFNYPMTKAQVDAIEATPFKYVGFNGHGVASQGLVQMLKYPLRNEANGDAVCTIKILGE